MITDITRVKRTVTKIDVKVYEELTRDDIHDLQETVFKPAFRFLDIEWTDGRGYRVSHTVEGVR